jgi:phenylpropionate dioxygenase-like ring-hydroxylating dioxygenase large terminal subunit
MPDQQTGDGSREQYGNTGLLDVSDYYLHELLPLEKAKLWPKVWLIACREEELKVEGDYVVLDIADESILLVHDGNAPRAFYNVCQHRGRRLKEGSGNTGKLIRCLFHGWRWSIDGQLNHVTDRDDWDGVEGCGDADLALPALRLESWGGWHWVSMNPEIEPLLDFLAPIPEFFAHHEIEGTRRAWYQSVVFPCNWKLALDAFNEGYHVEATHSQIAKYGRPKSLSRALGDHGWFGYPAYLQKFNPATAPAGAADFRKLLIRREEERNEWLHALISEYSLKAVHRLLDDLPEFATYPEVVTRYAALHREEMANAGVKWPDKLVPEDIERAGTSIHIFPNTVFLPSVDGMLWYRARPNGDDPNSCIYDIWWLQRYPEGKEPLVQHEFYPSVEAFKGVNPFLEQDFANLAAVQRGIKSRGFKGARPSPVQEVAISNFHRALHSYLARPA